MRLISFLLLTSFAAVPALAADETIVITANRSPQPLSRVGQSITVLDAAEITRRQTATVAELLRSVPGVTVARNGGIGGIASVFIRGANSDQTVALIDGVKINDPASPGGGFNFGNLLTGNIDRIEVLRGAQSVLWGSQAIGGVVNMITRAPTDALSANLRGEYGFRNTAQAVGNVSGKAGPLSASVGAGYFRTDGISAFSEARGGTEKDGYENVGANSKLNLAITDNISIEARGWYANGTAGIDGFAPPNYNFGDTLEIAKTREIVGYAGLNAALLDGRLRNRLGFAYTDVRRRTYDGSFETFAGNGRNERLEYQGIFDISNGWQATAGAERETSRYATSSYGDPLQRARARLDSVYGQLVVTPVTGFTVTGGVRHDDHSRFGGATTFGGSGVWTPGNRGTTLRASYAEGFKAPSLYQLQGDYGNQLLRPERSKGWDAGVTQRLFDGVFEASATWFARTSTDLIDFIACQAPLTGICVDRPFGTYDNILKARAKGVELAAILRPTTALRFQANYTRTDSRNRAPGANFDKLLARRPQDSLTTLIDYNWAFGLQTGATASLVGSSFDNASNTRRLDNYVLVDVRASYPVTPNIEVYGRVENLFAQTYETAFQYGQPGRAGYAGVRLRY
jgi:vitamin B12 transporter